MLSNITVSTMVANMMPWFLGLESSHHSWLWRDGTFCSPSRHSVLHKGCMCNANALPAISTPLGRFQFCILQAPAACEQHSFVLCQTCQEKGDAEAAFFTAMANGTGFCRERRVKERQQLADLVGKNLTYLSQLEGLDFPLYKATPPPPPLLPPLPRFLLDLSSLVDKWD